MNDPAPRRRRLTLGTLMIAIAFLALVTTVVVQSVRLREAAWREQRLRAEMEKQRLQADAIRLRELEEARARLLESEASRTADDRVDSGR